MFGILSSRSETKAICPVPPPTCVGVVVGVGEMVKVAEGMIVTAGLGVSTGDRILVILG
jgi:hypothetical protein